MAKTLNPMTHTPDCAQYDVIFDIDDGDDLIKNVTADRVIIASGSCADVFNKLKAKMPVKALLRHSWCYGDYYFEVIENTQGYSGGPHSHRQLYCIDSIENGGSIELCFDASVGSNYYYMIEINANGIVNANRVTV